LRHHECMLHPLVCKEVILIEHMEMIRGVHAFELQLTQKNTARSIVVLCSAKLLEPGGDANEIVDS